MSAREHGVADLVVAQMVMKRIRKGGLNAGYNNLNNQNTRVISDCTGNFERLR